MSDTTMMDALAKHERHRTVAETRYWHDQYKQAAFRLERENARLREDAERYRWCQDHPKEAQAMFWNYQSRKQRSAAIDKAMRDTEAT